MERLCGKLLSMVGHRGDGDGMGRWLGPHPPTRLWKATSLSDVVFLRSVRQQNKNEFMEIVSILKIENNGLFHIQEYACCLP